MWVITRIGFFNIIEQDDDREKGLLTVKARSREDLENFKKLDESLRNAKIEESNITDYRFRLKASRDDVVWGISVVVGGIDYGKTKPAIMKNFPERSGIYYQVWEDLYGIQESHETAKKDQA